MQASILSFGAGLLVGVIYSFIGVRSPAPPAVALVGLLGILIGEQIVPVARQFMSGTAIGSAWHLTGSGSHLFGLLPGRHGKTIVIASKQDKRP